MPSLLTEDDAFTTSTTKISSTSCTTRSLFALALHTLNLCVFLVVVVALLLLSPAAVVILLPVACMAASVCLLCATTARLLAPSVPPSGAREDRGGVREREQECVEVDVGRAEAPGGFGDGDGGASSAEEEEHGEQEQGRSPCFSSVDEEFSGSWDDEEEEQGRFLFVDTSSYCRTFYDLLAFWRSMERPASRGDRNAKYIR